MKRIPKIAYIVLASLTLFGCAAGGSNKVVLATHDSFVVSDELIAEFEKDTGLDLVIVKAGDAGALTNKLILTKGDPIADAAYGVDNTFLGAATDNGIFRTETVTAVDTADVCFNYDVDWFEKHNLAAPTDWLQLTQPAYRGLTVVENPTTSSTGLAFLASTVGRFGEAKWPQFWKALKDNDVKVAAGWEDAYYTHFSGSAGHGDYPIVLSYSSSPADEQNTAAILDGCFRQTEYAAVLKGAKNSAGAVKVVNWLLSKNFQESLPGAMYVSPVIPGVMLPESWAAKAPSARSFFGEGLDINGDRQNWLRSWSDLFG